MNALLLLSGSLVFPMVKYNPSKSFLLSTSKFSKILKKCNPYQEISSREIGLRLYKLRRMFIKIRSKRHPLFFPTDARTKRNMFLVKKEIANA